MEDQDFYIPSHLDDPPRMFFWEIDQAIAAMVPLGLGLITGFLFTSLLLSIGAAILVGKIKAGRGRGVVSQAMYWYLPGDLILKLRRTPPSHVREFCG